MTVLAKDRPRIVVDVPAEFAAAFLVEDMKKRPIDRPLLPLRLGDADLGMWQVMQVSTVRTDSDYEVCTATLRPVWP